MNHTTLGAKGIKKKDQRHNRWLSHRKGIWPPDTRISHKWRPWAISLLFLLLSTSSVSLIPSLHNRRCHHLVTNYLTEMLLTENNGHSLIPTHHEYPTHVDTNMSMVPLFSFFFSFCRKKKSIYALYGLFDVWPHGKWSIRSRTDDW